MKLDSIWLPQFLKPLILPAEDSRKPVWGQVSVSKLSAWCMGWLCWPQWPLCCPRCPHTAPGLSLWGCKPLSLWLGKLDDAEFPYIYATWGRARSGCSLPETWFKALLTPPSYFLSCPSPVFCFLWWEMQFYLCDSVCYRVVLVHPSKYLWLTERPGEENT